MTATFNLERFVQAQDPVLSQVRSELGQGRKRSHWMWFVFPQLAGLGHSVMAQHYAIASLAEAQAFLRHPILGPRLTDCTRLVNQVQGRSIHEIFGSPDDLKFHSCMTLFAMASPGASPFQEALDRHFGGATDPQTSARLTSP
jgi:uncharacterized protein (DUF1810 family)